MSFALAPTLVVGKIEQLLNPVGSGRLRDPPLGRA
jgi:hypothetical protein